MHIFPELRTLIVDYEMWCASRLFAHPNNVEIPLTDISGKRSGMRMLATRNVSQALQCEILQHIHNRFARNLQ